MKVLIWTLTFTIIGWIVGSLIGLSAAQSVDPTVLGGGPGRLVLQRDIVRMYGGWGGGIGVLIGITIDLIRIRVDNVRFSYRPTVHRIRWADDKEKSQIIEDLVAQRQRQNSASTASAPFHAIDQQQALDAQRQAKHDDTYWRRVNQANNDRPLKWPE